MAGIERQPLPLYFAQHSHEDGLRMKPGGGLQALMCAPPGTPLHTEAAADEPPMR